jgi:hypothetical protein
MHNYQTLPQKIFDTVLGIQPDVLNVAPNSMLHITTEALDIQLKQHTLVIDGIIHYGIRKTVTEMPVSSANRHTVLVVIAFVWMILRTGFCVPMPDIPLYRVHSLAKMIPGMSLP